MAMATLISCSGDQAADETLPTARRSSFFRTLDRTLRLADWQGYAARFERSQRAGRMRGRGVAHYVESSIGAPREPADVRIDTDGRVTVEDRAVRRWRC